MINKDTLNSIATTFIQTRDLTIPIITMFKLKDVIQKVSYISLFLRHSHLHSELTYENVSIDYITEANLKYLENIATIGAQKNGVFNNSYQQSVIWEDPLIPAFTFYCIGQKPTIPQAARLTLGYGFSFDLTNISQIELAKLLCTIDD